MIRGLPCIINDNENLKQIVSRYEEVRDCGKAFGPGLERASLSQSGLLLSSRSHSASSMAGLLIIKTSETINLFHLMDAMASSLLREKRTDFFSLVSLIIAIFLPHHRLWIFHKPERAFQKRKWSSWDRQDEHLFMYCHSPSQHKKHYHRHGTKAACKAGTFRKRPPAPPPLHTSKSLPYRLYQP